MLGPNPEGTGDLSSPQFIPSVGPHSFLLSGYRVTLPGAKGRESHVDHSPSSRTDFKSEWRYFSTSPIHPHDVERDKSSCTFLEICAN